MGKRRSDEAFSPEEMRLLGKGLRAAGLTGSPREFVRSIVGVVVESLGEVVESMRCEGGEGLTMRVSWQVRKKVPGCPECERDVLHAH